MSKYTICLCWKGGNIITGDDHLDDELIGEMNSLYGDKSEAEGQERLGKRRLLIIQVTALVIALLFTVSMFARHYQMFSRLSLDFLRESWALSRDPEIREWRDAVVQIDVVVSGDSAPGRQNRKGSGFNIDPAGLIVTNRHLVEDALSITVSFSGKGRYHAAAWSSASEADLAVIRLEASGLPVIVLEDSAVPKAGDTVTVIGNPLGFVRIATRGEVTGYRLIRSTAEPVLEIEASIHPGHSGSPVFNEAGGVVGVVFATFEDGDPPVRKGFAVPVSALNELLERQEEE